MMKCKVADLSRLKTKPPTQAATLTAKPWGKIRPLTRARADRDTATHLKEFAYLYICQEGMWDDFTEWMAQQTDTNPCNPVFDFVGSQERQLNGLTQQLNLTQQAAMMFKESSFTMRCWAKKMKRLTTLSQWLATSPIQRLNNVRK